MNLEDSESDDGLPETSVSMNPRYGLTVSDFYGSPYVSKPCINAPISALESIVLA